MKHVAALEIKRFHHSKRNKKGIMCEIIMPAAFVCLAMCMTLILPGLEEEPDLEISPWIYPTKVPHDQVLTLFEGWRKHFVLCQ